MQKSILCPIFVILLVLVGCSIKSGPTRVDGTTLKASGPLPKNAALYIMQPNDFATELGSGKKTQDVLLKALAGRPSKMYSAQAPELLANAFSAAANKESALLIEIILTDWLDPPASFQTQADRAEMLIQVYDVKTESLVRADNLRCSGWATTVNLIGSYSPEDCLQPVFEEWCLRAFWVPQPAAGYVQGK